MDKQYCKVFKSILTSTIWQEDDYVRLVWITLLALKDRFGEVAGSVPGLAAQARVSLENCEKALLKLSSPDAYSRTREHEGRRIMAIDGGWRILNHNKYRKMMGSRAEYFKDYRKNKKSCAQQKNVANVLHNASATHTDTDTDTNEAIIGAIAPDLSATPIKTEIQETPPFEIATPEQRKKIAKKAGIDT